MMIATSAAGATTMRRHRSTAYTALSWAAAACVLGAAAAGVAAPPRAFTSVAEEPQERPVARAGGTPFQSIKYFSQEMLVVEAENFTTGTAPGGWEPRQWGNGNYFCTTIDNVFHS
jgi:hypothetical protein